jgi:hypothetical protein
LERIEAVERQLGELPATVKNMLGHFNGAKLFDSCIRLFGITTVTPLSPLEWTPELCIDTYTPRWRAAGSNRQGDWAIGITNYGGLILFERNEMVKEWDTGQSIWLLKSIKFVDWMENVISEAEVAMAEVLRSCS